MASLNYGTITFETLKLVNGFVEIEAHFTINDNYLINNQPNPTVAWIEFRKAGTAEVLNLKAGSLFPTQLQPVGVFKRLGADAVNVFGATAVDIKISWFDALATRVQIADAITRLNLTPTVAEPVATFPAEPVFLATTEIQENSVVLNWNTPDDGGSPITNYTVTVLRVSDNSEALTAANLGVVNSLRVGSLLANTAYFALLQAVNAIGESFPTRTDFTTLAPEAVTVNQIFEVVFVNFPESNFEVILTDLEWLQIVPIPEDWFIRNSTPTNLTPTFTLIQMLDQIQSVLGVTPEPIPVEKLFSQEFTQVSYRITEEGKPLFVQVQLTRLESLATEAVAILQVNNQAGASIFQDTKSLSLAGVNALPIVWDIPDLGAVSSPTATITVQHFIWSKDPLDPTGIALAVAISVTRTITQPDEPDEPLPPPKRNDLMSKIIGTLFGLFALTLLASKGKGS